MAVIKLQSSDGVIFDVDASSVKQMVTIQTMIDHEDEDSDEVTPVPTVKAQVLEKIIQWTDHHKIDLDKTSHTTWMVKYFDVQLEKIFEIIIAADYLEVESLLNESCRNVLSKNKWEIIEDAASRFYDPTILTILKTKHEVILTIHDNKYLRYFDPTVRPNINIIISRDRDLRNSSVSPLVSLSVINMSKGSLQKKKMCGKFPQGGRGFEPNPHFLVWTSLWESKPYSSFGH